MWTLCVFPTGVVGTFAISTGQSGYVWPTTYGGRFECERIRDWIECDGDEHVMATPWNNPRRASAVLTDIARGLREEAMAGQDMDADALELRALIDDVVLVGPDGQTRFSFHRMALRQFYGPPDTAAMLAAARALEREAARAAAQ